MLKVTCIGVDRSCIGAVSYTHLDVYKRQFKMSASVNSDNINVIKEKTTSVKGSADDVTIFLEEFQNFELLWNVCHDNQKPHQTLY